MSQVMMNRNFNQHPDNATQPRWWRGGVVYQIYPRSFADSNGDGIGDLQGVISKLPYVADLGVDAIWLSPFFTSPMKDFGYDVADYCDVDPMFGTLADFKALVEVAHGLGLRVIIDQVLNHTSDQHPWFIESRSDRVNPKADWYVWADAKDDGAPPNNWQAIFIGSAWQWDSHREQYYLHNFLAEQPDLNVHNEDVQQALFDVLRFWLDLGVDGFRLDTVNFYMHDRLLRDNPARGRPPLNDSGVVQNNPYSWQHHLYDKTQPENLDFLRKMRAVLDEYPGITTVGEVGDEHSLAVQAQYTQGGDKLHTAYSFDLLTEAYSASYLRRKFMDFEAVVGDGWSCWALGNHDVTRLASRWVNHPGALRAFVTLLLTVRGSPCIYQGEELGLTEAVLTFEQLQDPYGIRMWPAAGGRDGCRTPMPWVAEAHNAGFGAGAAWLPVVQEHVSLAADQQVSNANSLWGFYRDCLNARRSLPALLEGSIEFVGADESVLAYVRSLNDEHVLCLLNLSESATVFELPRAWRVLSLADFPQSDSEAAWVQVNSSVRGIELSAWQTCVFRVDALMV